MNGVKDRSTKSMEEKKSAKEEHNSQVQEKWRRDKDIEDARGREKNNKRKSKGDVWKYTKRDRKERMYTKVSKLKKAMLYGTADRRRKYQEN